MSNIANLFGNVFNRFNEDFFAAKMKKRSRRQQPTLRIEQLEARNLLASFSGSDGIYQVYSNKGQLAELNIADRSFDNAANNAGEKLNAVGYRTADDYAYGILTGSNDQLAKLGSDGTVTNLGSISGLPDDAYFVGDFGGDDLLYLRGNRNSNVFYGVNVETQSVDAMLQLSTNLKNVYDIAYNSFDDSFYTSQRGAENMLVKIDASTGEVSNVGLNGIGKLTFGAMFADSTGSVYGSANQTGGVYSFDIATGEATLVGISAQSGTNDGFSNAFVELELAPYSADDDFSSSASDVVEGNLFDDNGNGGDVDGDGDSIAITQIQGQPVVFDTPIELDSGATITVGSDGTFEYDPNDSFSDVVVGQTATDDFEYTITDGNTESTATCTFTIDGEFGGGNAGVDITAESETDITIVKGVNDEARTTVFAAGDFNGDGYQDAVVGDSSVNSGTGATYVIYGTSVGMPSGIDVNTLKANHGGDGSQGLVINGINENDRFGADVSAVTDINNDGFDDIIIGASDYDHNGLTNAGGAFVIYGSDRHGAEFNVSDLLSVNSGDGAKGFAMLGVDSHNVTGTSVAGIGDINGDGLNDIAISSLNADANGRQNSGEAYVVFGSTNSPAEVELASLDGTNGFTIQGTAAHDHLGAQIDGGVDVNGDGFHDMVVTARDANSYGVVDTGESYLIYGTDQGFSATLDLQDLFIDNGGDGSVGTVFLGTDRSTGNGSYVSLVDDANGDFIGEIVAGIGDVGGQSYVVDGKIGGFGPEFQLISLKNAGVFADNFDFGQDYDIRSWDTLLNNVTLHSTEGTRVSIWGDPHVIVVLDGVESKFDIGYGAGEITLSTGSVISWDTYAHDTDLWPLGPPLSDFTIDAIESNDDPLSFDTADGLNTIDALTALTDSELREFALELFHYAGDANEPLTRTS